uniref:Uncharacterized protein n=1 Tax=Solanum lycopersicum TaxID=4081 RepID=A0A3Q7GSI8_SOLLC
MTSGMACIIAFRQHTRTKNIGHGMPSSPLGSTHEQTTSSVACHHRPWTAHTIRLLRAWHSIITLGLHMRLDDIGYCMTAWPLGSTHADDSGIACHQLNWSSAWSDDIGHGMSSTPLGSTRGQMTPGVTCHLFPWKAHTLRQHNLWHAIIAVVQHTR